MRLWIFVLESKEVEFIVVVVEVVVIDFVFLIWDLKKNLNLYVWVEVFLEFD